jgi:hypothetical protein
MRRSASRWKARAQQLRRGGIFVATQIKRPSQLRQERHIPSRTGLEILMDWFSTKISLLTELCFTAGTVSLTSIYLSVIVKLR